MRAGALKRARNLLARERAALVIGFLGLELVDRVVEECNEEKGEDKKRPLGVRKRDCEEAGERAEQARATAFVAAAAAIAAASAAVGAVDFLKHGGCACGRVGSLGREHEGGPAAGVVNLDVDDYSGGLACGDRELAFGKSVFGVKKVGA